MIYTIKTSQFVDLNPYVKEVAAEKFNSKPLPLEDYLDAMTVAKMLGFDEREVFNRVRNSKLLNGFYLQETELLVHPDGVFEYIKRQARNAIRQELKRSSASRQIH